MKSQNQNTGFALLTTIWVSAILSLLALSVLHAFNTNTEATHVDAMRIKHNMLHLAGVRYAALHLASPRHQVAPTATPNSELSLQLDSAKIHIKIENEAGRIDLLQVPQQVLAQILTSQGLSLAEANQLAANIQKLLAEQPRVSYRALRRMLQPFPQLYQKIIDDVSLHNGQAGVHALLVSESVLDLIPELSTAEKKQILDARTNSNPAVVSTPVYNAMFTDRLSAFYRISTVTILGDSRHTNIEIIKMTNHAGALYEAVATL